MNSQPAGQSTSQAASSANRSDVNKSVQYRNGIERYYASLCQSAMVVQRDIQHMCVNPQWLREIKSLCQFLMVVQRHCACEIVCNIRYSICVLVCNGQRVAVPVGQSAMAQRDTEALCQSAILTQQHIKICDLGCNGCIEICSICELVCYGCKVVRIGVQIMCATCELSYSIE